MVPEVFPRLDMVEKTSKNDNQFLCIKHFIVQVLPPVFALQCCYAHNDTEKPSFSKYNTIFLFVFVI